LTDIQNSFTDGLSNKRLLKRSLKNLFIPAIRRILEVPNLSIQRNNYSAEPEAVIEFTRAHALTHCQRIFNHSTVKLLRI